MTKSSLEIYVREMKTQQFQKEDINNIQALDSQWRIANKFPGDATVGKAGIPYTHGQISMFSPEKPISQNETDARGADLQNHYENLFQTQSGSGSDSRSGADSGSDSDSNSAFFLKNKKIFTIQIDDETEFELRKFKQQLEKERKEPVDWNITLKEMVKRAATEQAVRTKRQVKKHLPPGPDPAAVKSEQKTRKRTKMRNINHDSTPASPATSPPKSNATFSENTTAGADENFITLCKAHHDFVHQANIDENLITLSKTTYDFVHQTGIEESDLISPCDYQNYAHQQDLIFNSLKTEKLIRI